MKNYKSKLSYLIQSQEFRCASCGEMFESGQKIDLAHKIKASKYNYKKYGEDVIDHIFNLAATHHNGYKGMACNDKQNLSRATHPVETGILIEAIRKELDK